MPGPINRNHVSRWACDLMLLHKNLIHYRDFGQENSLNFSLDAKGNLKGKVKRNLLTSFVLAKSSFTDRDNFSLGQLLPNTSILLRMIN